MFNFLRRTSSQISQQPTEPPYAPDVILHREIDLLAKRRDRHLSEMVRLQDVVDDAQAALCQHTRLYEALNSTLFAINHPFTADAEAAETNAKIDTLEIDFDLSDITPDPVAEMDALTDGDEATKLFIAAFPPPTTTPPAHPIPIEQADTPGVDEAPRVPLRKQRKAA